MNVARRSDGLLGADKIVALTAMVDASGAQRTSDQLVRDFVSLHGVSFARTWNSLVLLHELGVLTQATPVPVLSPDSIPHTGVIKQHLRNLVAQMMADRIALEGRGAIQARPGSEDLWLDSRLLPGFNEGLPFLAIEFEVAQRNQTHDRFWRVCGPFVALLLRSASRSNATSVSPALTEEGLELRMEADAANGRMAEDWVVDFERRRLNGHPLLAQIRRISSENVAAGFDVLSFSTTSALFHDRYIEVKSHTSPVRFFWTSNEIAVARERGESYCLYLVDRTRLTDSTYEPRIIPGPYAALVEDNASGWESEPTGFEFRPRSHL